MRHRRSKPDARNRHSACPAGQALVATANILLNDTMPRELSIPASSLRLAHAGIECGATATGGATPACSRGGRAWKLPQSFSRSHRKL
jgi:hypothetical protein